MRGCLSHAPHWGPGPQPRHVSQLGIELVTLWLSRPMLNPLSYTSQGLNFLYTDTGPFLSALHTS